MVHPPLVGHQSEELEGGLFTLVTDKPLVPLCIPSLCLLISFLSLYFLFKVESHSVQLKSLGCLVTLVCRLISRGVVELRNRIQCWLDKCFIWAARLLKPC